MRIEKIRCNVYEKVKLFFMSIHCKSNNVNKQQFVSDYFEECTPFFFDYKFSSLLQRKTVKLPVLTFRILKGLSTFVCSLYE